MLRLLYVATILAALQVVTTTTALADSGGVGRHWLSTFTCPEGSPFTLDCEAAGSRMTVYIEKASIPRWMKGEHTISVMQEVYYPPDNTTYVHEAGWLTSSGLNAYRSDGSSVVRLQKYFYITELASEAQDVTGGPVPIGDYSLLSVNLGLDRGSACKLSSMRLLAGCSGSLDNNWNWVAKWYSGEHPSGWDENQGRSYESANSPRIAKLMDGTYIRDITWGDNSDTKFYYHAWWHPPQIGQSYAAWNHHHFWGSDYKEEPKPSRVNLYRKGIICVQTACFPGSVGDSQVGDHEWHACTGYVNGSDCDDPLEIPAGNCDESNMRARWPDPQEGPWVCVAITHTCWNNNRHRAVPPPGVGLSQMHRGPIPEHQCGACNVVNFETGPLWAELRALATDADDWQCPANTGDDQVEIFVPSSPQYPQHERRVNADISYIQGAGGGVEGLIERYVGWDYDHNGVPRCWGAHQDGQGRSYQWVEWYVKPLPGYCP